jgi:hypothetical protein
VTRPVQQKQKTNRPLDLYTMLADAHGWTPAQVDAMDPDFIFELSCFKTAQAQYAEKERERAERDAARKRRRS